MKEAFKDVVKLDSLEDVGLARKGCKFAEESGELMQVICRYVGMKANKMSQEEMKEEAFGEVADVIQNSFCIANQFGLECSDFVFPEYKTRELNLDKLAKNGCGFSNKVGGVMKIVDKKVSGKKVSSKKAKEKLEDVIWSAMKIASMLEIDNYSIEEKILEKNKKWMTRIDKNKLNK
jgi:NTP pyrophosphatase (non-canonical NTP hydrolase)